MCPGAISGASARIGSTSEALVRISVREVSHSGAMRSMESLSRGLSLASGNNCLGRCDVLTGQKREPTPPASTTHQTMAVPAARCPPPADSVTRIRFHAYPGQLRRPVEQAFWRERFRHEVSRA